jgi:TatD DNase family protein
MEFIDTHCHLEMGQFDNDRDEVILRARDSGLEALITIGSDLESNTLALKIAEKYPFVYTSVGIHPHDSKDFNDKIRDDIIGWSKIDKVVAIGETGLDYHYDNSPREVQRRVFENHLELAKDLDLPAVIHSREARNDTLDILQRSGITKGVLHCFSGDEKMAEMAMMMGLHISFAGPVTFKKATDLQEIVKLIPDDYLLIETDAPYLSPVPFRGKRNEPSFIVHTARSIAEIRGVSVDDVARITTINARKLFNTGNVPETGEIAYKIRNSLYLNITNRCTNRCTFCIRGQKNFVKGHNLRLSHEPSSEELIDAIGDPAKYKEVVFCGYGEPFLRLDVVKEVASWIKEKGGHVRINTNGHGNIIHKRNILPELEEIIDSLSISMDAPDADSYDKLCAPTYKDAYPGILDFIIESKKFIQSIQVTVVDTGDIDIKRCKEIADDMGVGFRTRKLDIVG